jgi:hypothetical protein
MVAEALQGRDVTHCRLPADGFMPRDNHPNAAGYDAMKACVEDVLGGWE